MPLNPVPIGFEALVTPEGELVYSPKANVENNVKNLGYRLPTSEDFSKATLKKEYGEGFGNELKAGVEGALSGATFGGSRHLANALGITTPEAQAARKEFNPIASGLGEAAGIGASLAFAPEASLPGLLAEGGLRAGAKAVGANVLERTVPGLLGKTIVRELEGTAAQKIAGQAVASGLEGLAYGASQPISESALGDPTLTASKAFSQIGLGGLIGGATGGAFSALGLGAKRFLPKGISSEAQAIVDKEAGGLPSSEINRIAKAKGVEPSQVEEFLQNRERIMNSPRLATKLDPVIEGQPTHTIEQSIRDSYEGLAPRIKELAESNQSMLEQAPISKAPTDIAKIFDDKISELGSLPVKGKQTNAAIERLQGFSDQLKNVEGDLNAGQIKGIIGEIDSDLEPFYAGKIGKSTTKEERVLLGLRRDLNEMLKKDMTAAGFADFETNLKEMSKLIDAQSRLEKSFGNATGYQRALSELSKADQGYKSGVPLVSRGTKKGVDWLQALDDLGEISGQDFRQMYHDRSLYSKLFPNQAVGPEEITSWPAKLIKEGIESALNPTDIPKKLVKGALSKSGGFFNDLKQKGIDDLLMGRSTNPGAVNSILGKLGDMTSKGSAFLEGPMSKFAVPAVVKFHEFIQDADSVDHADRKLEVLQALEKAQKKADGKISSAVNSIFSEKNHKFDMSNDFFSQSPDELVDQVDKLREHTNELVNNPETLLSHLDAANQGIQGAPDVVSAINMTAVRALQFLSQQMQMNMPQGEKLPLDPKTVPTKSQLYSLTKTMRFINQPWEVLHEVSSGRVSKEGKQVLENVHPELYNDLKAQVLSKISEMQAKGKIIPMSKRLGLSYFLDQPLDSTMTPQAIMSNQMAFLMPQSTQNAPTPNPSGAKNLDVSQRLLTPLQKVASRA